MKDCIKYIKYTDNRDHHYLISHNNWFHPLKVKDFATCPHSPLNFLDISLPPSKRGEEQTVIFGKDLVHINQCMILTFLCQRKSGIFRRWERLYISSDDSLCFSAQWWRCLRRAGILTGCSLQMEGCVYSNWGRSFLVVRIDLFCWWWRIRGFCWHIKSPFVLL